MSVAFSYLYKVVSHYFGSHEHEHDGEAVCDISCGLHHDNSQTESHSHNATCGDKSILPNCYFIILCSFTRIDIARTKNINKINSIT